MDRSLGKNGLVCGKPRSPGMKYRHYAPSAPMVLVEGDAPDVVREIKRLSREYIQQGKIVGVLCREGNQNEYSGVLAITAGTVFDQFSVAAQLFDALRRFDNTGVEVILAEGVEDRGLGMAVSNRLRKAAGGNIIRVQNLV